MKEPILARIVRIRSGHSERALVHAVGADEHEYKLEVPAEAVASLPPGHSHMLVLWWSIHASPAVVMASPTPATPATPVSADEQFVSMMNRGVEGTPASPTAPPPVASVPSSAASTPASVDEQFMTLMNRGKAGAPAPDDTPPLSGPERHLATLLGVPTRG